ncbi:MAG: hypothetical protein MJZ16_09400, partial [Bacteroidales bacterium]|nr:hypothetical protein [Bacteroidales bacterium]
LCACSSNKFTQVTTTEQSQWVEVSSYNPDAEGVETDIIVDLNAKGQTMQGFGMCFSELSWRSLNRLSKEDYNAVMKELFAPGVGASLTICRMPIGSSDFALKYYSFDDYPGDFAMEHFTIENDEKTLIPLIKDALSQNPDLKVWGSPWCPPEWMKVNKNYASRPMNQFMFSSTPRRRPGGQSSSTASLPSTTTAEPSFLAGLNLGSESRRKRLELDNLVIDNGCRLETMMREGQDSFILEEEYLDAYALYFKKYVQAYREKGINIFMVMPQNEFNSAQNFPSCTWTVAGLLKFMQKLVPAMKEEGVEVYYGTVERANRGMVDTIFMDPGIGDDVKGVSFQWAGKGILKDINESYPQKAMVMSEQQCFNGANSWKDFIAAWDLLKENLDNGVEIYDYWNMSLFDGEVSTWGWQQNSLISVDYETGSFKYNYEYYEMKHASHFMKPGAVYLGTSGSHGEVVAFQNPDKSIVLLIAEKEGKDEKVTITAGKKTVSVNIPANSLSTVVI